MSHLEHSMGTGGNNNNASPGNSNNIGGGGNNSPRRSSGGGAFASRGINPLNIGVAHNTSLGSMSSLNSGGSMGNVGSPLSPGGESNISLPSLSNFPAEQREELRKMYLAGFRDAARKAKAKKQQGGGGGSAQGAPRGGLEGRQPPDVSTLTHAS